MSFQIDENNLKNNVPKVLLEIFKEAFGDFFHLYREGDPIIPAISELPALFITEENTEYEFGPTGHDEIRHEIVIQVVLNKKQDFGNPDHGSSLDHHLDALCQGRDETTGDFKDETVMGILRKQVTLGDLMIESIGSVKKGIVTRSEELITAEAHIDLVVTEIQAVSNRT
jgi:hypothetical protein